MKALFKLKNCLLIAALFFAASLPLYAQDKPACNSTDIRRETLNTPAMEKVKTSDTSLGFRLEIGDKVKIISRQKVIMEIDKAPTYLCYKQSAEISGKKSNYFLIIAIGSSNHSYFFIDCQEIRELIPALKSPKYDYFRVTIGQEGLLFDFSQSGERSFHFGNFKNNVFCDGGEAPF